MRIQKEIWQKEHETSATLPNHASIEPSKAVVWFAGKLKELNVALKGKAIDVGCGKGRNSIYLAKLGLNVTAIDYISLALKTTNEVAKREKVENKIETKELDLGKTWSFKEGEFDLAIDNYASIDIENRKDRANCINEMHRVLKNDGFGFISVVSIEDEFEKTCKKGEEHNSVFWPNGKFQKDYDEKELSEWIESNGFKLIELKKVNRLVEKYGKKFTSTDYWAIFKK